MNGDDGLDRIEDNLGAADDISQLSVVNGKVHYARVNAPFTLDVASSEVFELNTFGGNDTLDVAPGVGALIAVTVDAGSGDDKLKGGDEADTFFGGLGNDTLDTGAGSDVADGQDGDDTLAIRDGAADLARGGAGTDTATADFVDAVGADVEKVDRAKSGANALTLRKNAKVTRTKAGKYSAQARADVRRVGARGLQGQAVAADGQVGQDRRRPRAAAAGERQVRPQGRHDARRDREAPVGRQAPGQQAQPEGRRPGHLQGRGAAPSRPGRPRSA